MNLTIYIRTVILIAALLFLVICTRLTKAPLFVIKRLVSISWIAGIFAALGDSLAVHFGFWHYLPSVSLFGLSLDLYVATTLVAAGCGVLFWYLKNTKNPFFPMFLVSIPVIGLLNDWIGNRVIGNTLPIWDSQYWFIVDFLIWTFVWIIMVNIYQKTFRF